MASQVEIPGVNNAVEHLQELGDRMRHDFGFSETDVGNIDQVIEALRELEILRSEAHDRLEAETIRASIQRHRLQFLPGQITQEITDAINSAKKSNADAIVYLKKQLENVNKNIVYLEGYQKQLDEENAQLHPEREQVRQQHEEIISQLNQRMAEKASMQIQLNETRDKVRQTNQDIVDLEDGILQLKEDLIQERGEARSEKRQLKKAVASTTEKTKEQKLVNVEKKKDLDVLHEKQVDSEGKLDALRKSLRRYETSKAKLEGQERALTAQLQKQLKQNEELRQKGAAILAEDAKTEKEFEENKMQLTNKLQRMENEIVHEEEKYYELDLQREGLAEELEGKMKIRMDDAERVADLDSQLQADKRNLSSKAEEVGEMQGQNTKMLEDIETLGETHKAVMAQLNKQVEEYREQLARERKERLDVQQKKNSVSKELEDYKTDNQRFMQEMNTTITQGKQDHIALSNEGAQLQRELRADDDEIKDLEEKLEQEQEKYQKSFTKRQNEVDTMEREVIEMENNIAEKTQKIQDVTPAFDDLEKRFEERTQAYDTQKKSIVELKTKKSQQEEKLKKLKEKKERMTGPQDKLRHDLKQKRHEIIFQLKHHGEETKKIESEIYVGGCKLKTVLDENHKLEEGCKQFTEEIDDIQYQMEYNEKLKAKLLEELLNTKEILGKTWQEDHDTQQKFTDRDQCVVDEFGNLLDRTSKREQKISGITSQLEVELGYLTSFLDNLASRRPKDSYLSQCRTPPPDSRGSSRLSSREGRLSRLSTRSQTLLEMVAEANQAESHKSSRPATSKSARSAKSVVISEEVTEIQTKPNMVTKSLTKLS
ncbi:centrosomal protein of 290 kDa-like isoform X9 [Mercenaria mercenaria]|uniref:centrosomal protein of 290 kDa-like isoform X9 n=1 Tax=Mercenaria mercenaria TaxID=6596 RepID=UPI00234EEC1F|nr:centrosomal protein of 290 kDa-like isoform X9 [Mercenaria mercenaria]